MANLWQGPFPHGNTGEDGFLRTSPVGIFPASGFGLHDMIGNVWGMDGRLVAARPCRARGGGLLPAPEPARRKPRRKRGPGPARRPDPARGPKGESHLSAPSYCRPDRPAACQPQPIDSTTGHIGFRCGWRGPGPDPPADLRSSPRPRP